MKKTISAAEYLSLLDWLIAGRVNQSISMRDLAIRLDVPHSFVQKIESRERRLDVYEYVKYCNALGLDPNEGVKILEGYLKP